MVRLGGFVIHGSSATTLEACLRSLSAVSDVVAAVDSGSSDGSAQIARAWGARCALLPWQGYGAARARAAELLADCDYLLFLDSDEWLEPEAIDALRRWKASSPRAPYYQLLRRDWAELPGRRFLFRVHRHVRLVGRAQAPWTPQMIVHEAAPRGAPKVSLPIAVEHHFASSVQLRAQKEELYALLWALRAHAEGRRSKPAWLQQWAHTLRNAAIKGALCRGGLDGLRLSWSVSRYHARKHEHLARLRRGHHAEEVALLAAGDRLELFRRLAEGSGRVGPGEAATAGTPPGGAGGRGTGRDGPRAETEVEK